MKRLFLAFAALCILTLPAAAAGFDETINSITAPIASLVGQIVFFKVPFFGAQLTVVVLWLVAGAVFFTFYLGFINIRGFKHAIELVRGDYANPDDAGEVSHFQALATAVSGTVGIGNIGGVAVAVTVGGPGATFWLIVAGFLGMSTKFVECTLGVKYRNEFEDGHVSGGPMYYLRKGFGERGMEGFGKFLGHVLRHRHLHRRARYRQHVSVEPGLCPAKHRRGRRPRRLWLAGWADHGRCGFLGHHWRHQVHRQSHREDRAVHGNLLLPFALIVIFMNFTSIPEAIGNIFSGALTGEGVAGGALGALIIGFPAGGFL